jgi:predicted nucleotidyltransferase
VVQTDAPFDSIVRAVLAVSQPSAIVLFGSHARGDAHEFSDVDLLIIRKEEFRAGESRRRELGRLYRSISKVCEVPKDIILYTGEEFRSWKNTTNHTAASALKEGRVLYGQI